MSQVAENKEFGCPYVIIKNPSVKRKVCNCGAPVTGVPEGKLCWQGFLWFNCQTCDTTMVEINYTKQQRK